MQLIIQSYLKTFLKHWVSTIGTLLFIIMLACVVMGLMSTPLQLQMHIQQAKNQSTSYDWQVDEREIDFSPSFAFDYFVLNGYNYSTPSEGHDGYLIDPWTPRATVIAPASLGELLNGLKSDNPGQDFSTIMLTRSSYLHVDGWALNYISNSSSRTMPPRLEGRNWWEYFELYSDPDLRPEERLFIRNFLLDFAKFITLSVRQADSRAIANFTYRLNSPNVTDAQSIAKYFVEDLDTNIKIQTSSGPWFTDAQKLYLYNSFLTANGLEKIASVSEWDTENVTGQLVRAANQSKQINGLAIAMFNPLFRQSIVDDYHNDVEAYLVSTALTTTSNPKAMEGGVNRYAVQTKLVYSLSEVIPGNFTPSFSTDVQAIGNKDTYDHLILDQGREPIYNPNAQVREIVVSPSFLKKNKLTLGSTITLPKAQFAGNISLDDEQSQNVAGLNSPNNNVFKIVGTGVTYDQLIPGASYLDFLQSLKEYTYSYLPNNYVEDYQKAAFLYYSGSIKNHPLVVLNKVKDENGSQNPYYALVWIEQTNNSLSYGMYGGDTTTLVTAFSKLSTIAGLNTIKIQLIIYITLGLVSLILAFIFINFIIKKEINETRRQLGIFKSFGYGIAELSLIFATKTLITITIGIIIGWLCSIPLQLFMATNFSSSVMFSYQKLYVSALLLVTLFIIIPLLFTLVSYFLTLSYLREPALSLINNRQKMPKHKPHNGLLTKYFEHHDKGFNYRLSGSFVKTAMGKFVVVQLLFGFSALLYTLIFGARTVMYQVINQGFDQINAKTDHEYDWENRNSLIIDDTTGNRYALRNSQSWDQDKINYINYKGYENPLAAMDDLNNPAINSHLNLSRYSFRVFFDALSNSIVQAPTTLDLNDWWLLPQSIALERYAEGRNWSPDITEANYYLYKVMLYKGTEYGQLPALNQAVMEMHNTHQAYQGDLTSVDFNGSWIQPSLDPDALIADLKKTFLGITAADSNNLTNNLFLTDLSRFFAMMIAENYATTRLEENLSHYTPSNEGRYKEAEVIEALQRVASLPEMRKFDPRNPIYWGFTPRNPLVIDGNKNPVMGMQANEDSFDLENIFKDIKGISFSLLAAAMVTQGPKSLADEPVVNFNNLFYDSSKEQLQLDLEMIPENKDWGKTSILLSDFHKGSVYGSPDNVYNFDGVSSAQWAQMITKPGDINEPYFNGIIPYAIAELYDVKIGDTFALTTQTSVSVPIKIKVIAINRSVTLPLSRTWQINVDYNTFAQTMFSPELQSAIKLGESPALSPYYFNGIISHTPMVNGKIKVSGIGESLETIKFVGNQITVSLASDKMAFASLWQTLIDYLLQQLEGNTTIPPDVKEKIKSAITKIRAKIEDPRGSVLTNPMILGSDDGDKTLVSVPYNLVRVGVRDFAGTMNQLMFVFLLLQSVLLMITLVVVMNIVVDEAAVMILTLRSLGYSHNEINWIIMGPYVFWVIISFIIAYIISMVAWRLLLTYAQNRWSFIIHFRFNIVDLVVPFCVLAVIMLVGWLASDYSVHRRPLTQITDSA